MTKTHNYQQLNLKKQKKKTKQTTRIVRESQKWRSHEGLSVEMGRDENGGKEEGIRSLNGRYKIDRERLRKWRSQRTYMYYPWI